MILAHKIALDPNDVQETYFRKAAGVARFAYNWALDHLPPSYPAAGNTCMQDQNTSSTSSVYFLKTGSPVRSFNGPSIACAIKRRSNGSR